jgi:hypothetical protein
MKRLLQLGTWLILLVTLLAPISECFDRWDAPGLGNDSEFALFVLVLSLVFVLLISKLISAVCLAFGLVVSAFHSGESGPSLAAAESEQAFVIPPLRLSPLRI